MARSMRGTKTYGGCGTSHSTTEAFGRAKNKALPLPGYPAEKPFASVAEVDAYFANEPLQCLLCGHHFKSLTTHLRKHGYLPDEYRERFGIPYTRGLVTSDLIRRRSVILKDVRNALGEGRLEEIRAVARERSKSRRPAPKRSAAAIEAAAKGLIGKKRPDLNATVEAPCSDCGKVVTLNKRATARAVHCCEDCRRERSRASWRKYGATRGPRNRKPSPTADQKERRDV